MRLLKDTDMPISAISGKIGITNTNHLKNVFRREVGTSMRNYRSDARSSFAVLNAFRQKSPSIYVGRSNQL